MTAHLIRIVTQLVIVIRVLNADNAHWRRIANDYAARVCELENRLASYQRPPPLPTNKQRPGLHLIRS
jgi:hypothetical protein